ncbi:MAG: helix-turn-helix transcriptional regulator [Lachnospiraceae bacterium]|nr:helix-turn-helix transcriptional regulator [Lachnospiraceae bacterium]
MSLGENLQFLRKRNDITQEQLAEKLNVSRQSVSKWESDTAYPEMDKLLQLCETFNCRLDDMIKGDISSLYVEDKAHYDEHMNLFSKMTAIGVGLILFGLAVMSFLSGIGINDDLSAMVFFVFLIIAVAIFIVMGIRHSDFEKKNPCIENFYSEEEKDAFNKKYSVFITVGVVIILIAVLILMSSDLIISEVNISQPYDVEELMGSVFFVFITVAVMLFIYAGTQKDKYNIKQYNLEHDENSETYKKSRLTGAVCGCLMMIATIIYLICGFAFNEWGMPSVVVFPVFGIGCGIASIIINIRK